ncbi:MULTISPECIES: oligosaccharide flippase family protein [Bacteroides]|uniref:oligosaccharide flippase family protein n=1 Tax=Bacteroides TaxID=816 RepID=UPI00033D3BAE|nr:MULTISPECIES: oligosaccharide flippase family protein [Bacteroides]UYU43889.1 oligosaccharide flippase family protein [Bacteroides salyersiae]CCY49909.1 pTS system polysaccharide transporter [Bacteroides sp. CAG:189]
MNVKAKYARLKGSSLFQDSFWALLGSALGKGLALMAGIAIARFMGKDVYGEYGMIKNTLVMIAIFSTFGLGYTATKFIADCTTNDKSRVYSIHYIATIITLIASGIIALLVCVFAIPLSLYLEAPHLSGILRWAAVAIIFNAINTTQIGELSGFNAYKIIAFNNTITGIFTFIVSIILTYYNGLIGAVVALVLTNMFNCALNYYSLRKLLLTFQKKIEFNKLREVISFSLPIALQESLYAITHWVSTIIIVKLSGYGDLGVLSVVSQWSVLLLFVPGALRNVALSHLSGSLSNDKYHNVILKRLLFINFISTFVPFLIIGILSKWICSWYGESYNGMIIVFNVAIFTTIINSLTNVYTQELISKSQNWYLFFTRLLRDSGILIFTYFAINIYANGALIYTIASLIFQSIYLVLLKHRYTYFIKKC